MKTINNVEVYVTGSGPEAVVMFHDIFGLHTGRHKQIADELASRDLTVVVPDFFGNESSEFAGGLNKKEERGYGGGLARFMYLLISGKFKAFRQQHPWDPVCKNIWVDTIAPYVKNDLKCTSVGLLSFCWGAYPAVHATALNPPASNLPVRANVCFHPSFDRTAANWSEDQEQLVKAAGKIPTLIVATGMESKDWKPEGQAHQWMKESGNNVKWVETKQKHGFMTRGDMTGDLELAKDIEKYLEEAIVMLKKAN
ncbi:hypothetical protein TrLO_g13970 [Triparma laevis f. longispina]|uniref:Dienelactone hydrolase domain-containing protein n=1 Tax=Triparma laevis f. longispina TaxID=1714387 RepID=A0A9W7CBU9_9STRA|nr:hypothetical protein TrLO_g13970 [Triparma laevis f. longispina]